MSLFVMTWRKCLEFLRVAILSAFCWNFYHFNKLKIAMWDSDLDFNPNNLLTKSLLACRKGNVNKGTKLSMILHLSQFSITVKPFLAWNVSLMILVTFSMYDGAVTIRFTSWEVNSLSLKTLCRNTFQSRNLNCSWSCSNENIFALCSYFLCWLKQKI